MAKKTKKVKAGVKKRQQQKSNKRKALKSKLVKKPAQKKMSMSKLKKGLVNVPKLIFEEELVEESFGTEAIEQAIKDHDNVPDQIEAVVTPEVNARLMEKFQGMAARFEAEKDQMKLVMIKAVLYYVQTNQVPAIFNHIAVAIFLRDQHKITGEGEEATEANIISLVEEYEKTWKDILEVKSADFEERMKALQAGEASENTDEFINDEDEVLSVSVFESFIEDTLPDLAEENNIVGDEQERVIQDLELFFIDYLEERGITAFDQLKDSHVRRFVDTWFTGKVNPTKEDYEMMFDSLGKGFKLAHESGKMTKQQLEDFMAQLMEKDNYLARMD